MKILSGYLAHPFDLRHEIRRIEQEIEKESGIILLNPFYDVHRPEIIAIDADRQQRSSLDLDFCNIVENDLAGVENTDFTLAYIQKGIYSIGTLFEIWDACNIKHKPVFIISPDTSLGHPWVRYVIKKSGGIGFSSWDDFKDFVKTGGLLETIQKRCNQGRR